MAARAVTINAAAAKSIHALRFNLTIKAFPPH
jgi:hypothetical protein